MEVNGPQFVIRVTSWSSLLIRVKFLNGPTDYSGSHQCQFHQCPTQIHQVPILVQPISHTPRTNPTRMLRKGDRYELTRYKSRYTRAYYTM